VVNPASFAGFAAGVPFVAVPPPTPRPDAPVVCAWHLLDSPRSEPALAAALPLAGLEAWRVYFGLPLCGARLPSGGWDEVVRLAATDPVLGLHGPIARQGAAEFPAALAAVRERFRIPSGPVAVVGGSIGAAVAQLAITESAPAAGIAVDAAVLVSPVIELSRMIDALSEKFGAPYAWSDPARELARRLDFPSRAADFARQGQPAVRVVVGADDLPAGFLAPAERLRDALRRHYDDPSRVDLAVVPGMGHALAEEPGFEPAPQTAHAAAVDRLAVAWLRQHLRGAVPPSVSIAPETRATVPGRAGTKASR
jgi:dienelactone hydrolase